MKYFFVIYVLLLLVYIPDIDGQNNPIPTIWLKGGKDDVNFLNTQDSLCKLNYNNKLNFEENRILVERDKLNRDNTFFVVFKHHQESLDISKKIETIFAEFHFNGAVSKISDTYIHSDKLMRIKSGDPSKGIALNFSNSFQDLRLKKGINYTFIKDRPEIDLYEILVYNQRLSASQMLPIQTYLSLKYGISLDDNLDYRSAVDVVLWDYKKNKAYAKRITGLGRSDLFELQQLQTQNSNDSLFRMGLEAEAVSNSLNKGYLNNESFFIYGDNGQPISFIPEDKVDFDKLQRVWKYDKTKNFSAKNVYIKLAWDQFIDQTVVHDYFLYINNSTKPPVNLNSFKLVKGVIIDSSLVFNNIVIDKNTNKEGFISLYRKRRFELEANWLARCDASDGLKLTIIGGTKPYTIKFINNQGVVEKQQKTQRNELDIDGINQSNEGVVVIQDALGTTIKRAYTDIGKSDIPIELKTLWILNEGSRVRVTPFFTAAFDRTLLQYEWALNGQIIGNGPALEAIEKGDYTLKVISDKACFLLPFTIVDFEKIDQNNNDKNGIFPNPVKAGEPFTVQISFPNPITKAQLSVFTIKGQFLTSQEYTQTNHITYTHFLNTAGTYIILVKSEATTRVFKLIVQ